MEGSDVTGEPFREVGEGELRDENGLPLMPVGVRYVAIEDFRVGRALYLTDDGGGETIVVQIIVSNDEGHAMVANFALCDEAAVGMFAALGMAVLDRGIGLPDLVAAHEQVDEINALRALEEQFDPEKPDDD